MQADVMEHFGLSREFRNVGYFETEYNKRVVRNIKTAIRQGKIIAVSGIVGCGKTTTLRKIQEALIEEKEIIVSRSLAVEKQKVKLPTLFLALFYDLSPEINHRAPTQTETRERKLQALIRQNKKPVVLFIDEAHDLHGATLKGIKRLIEIVQDCGGTLSVVLAGHPKLKNDLKKSSFEEIGLRTEVFDLDGITASKREYIEWLLEECTKQDIDISTIITDEAIDLLAERLQTPLQIEHHLSLAFTGAFDIARKPVDEEMIESVLTKDLDGLEPKLTRYGYSAASLAESIEVPPKVIRAFLKGKLSPEQTKEVSSDLLAAGIPL